MVFRSETLFLLLLQVGVITAAEDPQLIILMADYGLEDQNGNIYKLNIHHMNISRIPVSVIKPRALDYDHTDGLIYFTDLNTKQIRRVDVNGGNDVEVASLNSSSIPEGLTLDPDTRQMFYTDNGNNLIGRVEMDNFNHRVIVNTGWDKPRGIVADTKNKKLYWVDFGNNPKLETSGYDGGQRTTLIYSGLTNPLEITIDEEAGRLYWTEGCGDIESVGVDGRDRRIITTEGDRSPSHMTLFNGYMYYTYFNDSDIVAISLDQKKESTILSSAYFKRPRGLHAFSPNFEVKVPCKFGQYGRDCTTCGACLDGRLCEKTTGVCFIGCQPGYTTEKCTTEKCRPGTFGAECQSICKCRANSVCNFVTGSCPDGCLSGWKGDNCSINDPQLIILIADFGLEDQNGNIYKLNIHHVNISRIPVSVIAPAALDYDHTDGLIYFTDLHTKQIRRVDITGGNDVEVASLNSTSSPEGLTLDPNTRQVFYTDNGNNLIGRVEMDNFNHTVIVNTGLDQPRGIVADTKNKKLYWVDYGSNSKIETSDYDGGQRTTLIYSGLTDPLEITIDEEAGRLYWTEGGGDIESVSVDGRDRRNIGSVRDKIPSHMTLFNGYMYYTYFHDSYMVALSLDQKKKYSTISSAYFKRPRGLHAFSPNFEVKVPCKFGQYGRNCTTCGACLDESLCEKTTGVCFIGCQSGYTTEKCTEKCRPGTFGAECQSTCKCRANSVCDFVTGSCPDECQSGWKGDNCSIKCSPGTFGDNCGSTCSQTCKSDTVCDAVSGLCEEGCQSGWKGDYCTERFQGEPEQDEGPPIGLIAGVVGGVVAVIIVVVVAVCVIKRKTKEPEYTSRLSPETPGYETLNMGGINPASGDIATVY